MIDPLVENNHYDYTPYAYVYNNPMLFTDPFGLDSISSNEANMETLDTENDIVVLDEVTVTPTESGSEDADEEDSSNDSDSSDNDSSSKESDYALEPYDGPTYYGGIAPAIGKGIDTKTLLKVMTLSIASYTYIKGNYGNSEDWVEERPKDYIKPVNSSNGNAYNPWGGGRPPKWWIPVGSGIGLYKFFKLKPKETKKEQNSVDTDTIVGPVFEQGN